MPTNALRRTLDRLRQTLAPSDVTDEQLLQRFIADRNETAFAGLVRRHGSMVFGVCRRVLGNLHDSEDVFQATFLVLAQKARSVVKREALASWLYKVAYRIALKARTRNERRRRKEKQVDVMPHPFTQAPAVQDWEAVLDEELNRLPEKYRIPVILCDLEGKTGKEAERRLRLAPGTLSSRLSTARRMLAKRLTRRGLTVSGGALALALSETAAAIPPGLVGTTAQKAVLVAGGQLAAISSSVTILMKAGVKAMFLAKLKATVTTLMVIAVLGGGLAYSGSGGGPAKPQNELDALRRENELLRVNLRVTLEKIEVLEKQVKDLKGQASQENAAVLRRIAVDMQDRVRAAQSLADIQAKKAAAMAEAARAASEEQKRAAQSRQQLRYFYAVEALQSLQANENSKNARQKALDALEKAVKELRELEQKSKK